MKTQLPPPVDTEARDKARRKRFFQILAIAAAGFIALILGTADGATIKTMIGMILAMVVGVLGTLWKPWKP